MADEVLRAGKLLGIYHYASGGNQIKEAEHFLNVIKPYLGKATLWLDWEGDQNPAFGKIDIEWCRLFLLHVKKQTGVTAGIYMSKSVCRAHDWSKIQGHPLWCAQYADNSTTGYQSNPWTDIHGFGAWDRATVYQYSSHGRLAHWSKDLDLNIAWMSREQWGAMAKGEKISVPFPDKTDTELGIEIWANRYGSGDARRQALGIRYDSAQNEAERLNTVHISEYMKELESYEKKHGALFS
jgi:lysozyme